MRNKRKKLTAFLLVFIMALGAIAPTAASAASFPSDAPPDHWAFNAIETVYSMGLMQGDGPGLFGVSSLINMFDTARILAQFAGYKRIGATAEEHLRFEEYYQRHSATIAQYSHWQIWRHEFNREIAFLLERGILLVPDLENFVQIRDGIERQLALTRQTLVMFMVRLLGVQEQARTFVPANLFNDDHDIHIGAKPYVYFARHIGLFQGDGNNNFNPRSGVTKASMAVVLVLAMDFMGAAGPGQQQAQQPPQATISTTMGIIDNIHANFRAIEIRSPHTGHRTMFTVSTAASIIIDGQLATFAQLTANMNIAAIVTNNEITELSAISPPAAPPPQEPPPQGQGQGQGGHASLPHHLLDLDTMGSVIEGRVSGTRQVYGDNLLDLEFRWLNTFGEVTEETRTFVLNQGAELTRGDHQIGFENINVGDLARLTIVGSVVFNIHLEERVRNIVGTVTARRAVEGTGQAVISVRDAVTERVHELVTTNATTITRVGHAAGIPRWSDIRIGDHVEIQAEFNQLISIFADGRRHFVDVYITGIHITAGTSSISAMRDGTEVTYPIIPGFGIDPYALRVGSFVRLGLDSMEIEDILVLTGHHTQEMTAYLRSVTVGRIMAQNVVNFNDTRTFEMAENAVLRNAQGLSIPFSALHRDMRAVITFTTIQGVNFITDLRVLE